MNQGTRVSHLEGYGWATRGHPCKRLLLIDSDHTRHRRRCMHTCIYNWECGVVVVVFVVVVQSGLVRIARPPRCANQKLPSKYVAFSREVHRCFKGSSSRLRADLGFKNLCRLSIRRSAHVGQPRRRGRPFWRKRPTHSTKRRHRSDCSLQTSG